jgi:hypothetical protein
MKKYKTTVSIEDGCSIHQINQATGEIKEITQKITNKSEEGFSNPMRKTSFTRHFTKSWQFLRGKVSDRELRIIIELRDIATWKTNSLRPLGDDTTKASLSKQFNINQRYVDQVFNKLFDLGILAKTQVNTSEGTIYTYWLFNPYLGFNGPVMDDATWEIFSKTSFALLHK